MNQRLKTICFALAILLFSSNLLGQTSKTIVINAEKPTASIQPTMWGLFFEDINFAADGGIYAELVKNRSFEFDDPFMGWQTTKNDEKSGRLFILNTEKNGNSHFIRIETYNQESGFGIVNEGFRGIGVKASENYNLSLLARNNLPDANHLSISIVDTLGKILGQIKIEVSKNDWIIYNGVISVNSTFAKANLKIIMESKGSVDLDMISLFPQNTWKNRPNGLRKDLVQLLADMKPGFLRFPGGCIVEGRILSNRYQWKNTVGDPINRKLIINRWNTEFAHRPTPDYFQSYGLGFFEYFQLAEDIGAEPLPIMNCGMACQFNTAELVPLENLDPYIQDILDLIEFANGDTNTKWGKLRLEMGHPAPFNLKMMGVGNEQWGPQYIERYQKIARVLKSKYPSIKLISGSGPFAEGEWFNFSWDNLRKLNADIVDEHYYKGPEWFLKNASRYDYYDRKGPKVFAGEYAAQSKWTGNPENQNNWKCALSEAAFMTGLERNADVVQMSSYAPLFAHTEAWQWTPDLIWFDNLNSYGTPNYYVQKMYASNRGSSVVPALQNGKPLTGQDSIYVSASIQKETNEIIVKLVNISSKVAEPEISIEGIKSVNKNALLQVLTSNDLEGINTIDKPMNISPVIEKISLKRKSFQLKLKAYSFNVLRVAYQ